MLFGICVCYLHTNANTTALPDWFLSTMNILKRNVHLCICFRISVWFLRKLVCEFFLHLKDKMTYLTSLSFPQVYA